MNINFSKTIEIDGEELELDFEASFVKGGIGAYEHFGFKGYQSNFELDEIVCISTLNEKQAKIIDEMISEGEFDEKAWDVFNNQ